MITFKLCAPEYTTVHELKIKLEQYFVARAKAAAGEKGALKAKEEY